MSFTTEVNGELLRAPIKKTCCRRALALGMFLSCRMEADTLTLYVYDPAVANAARELAEHVFRAEVLTEETVRAGRKTYAVRFRSNGVSSFLKKVDEGTDEPIHLAVGFRCAACGSAFLRGIFLGCGTVNDPRKSYHLEMILPTEGRADLTARYLEGAVGRAGRAKRSGRFGVYYKGNAAIADFLYVVGCSRTGFELANVSIERDIRNNENRATNCVARNISRSVGASQKQIAAIERLRVSGRLSSLPEEMRYTAELRVENPAASLFELAAMHTPPITKSGLNGRLKRLMEEAEEVE